MECTLKNILTTNWNSEKNSPQYGLRKVINFISHIYHVNFYQMRARKNQTVELQSKPEFNGTYGCYQFKKPMFLPTFLKQALCVQKETNLIC